MNNTIVKTCLAFLSVICVLTACFTACSAEQTSRENSLEAALDAYHTSGCGKLPYGISVSDLFVADGVLFGRNTLLRYPEWIEWEHYAIPDFVEFINDSAFAENKHLRSVTIPDSCILIGEGSFAECPAFEEVLLGEDSRLLIIETGAFRDCRQLKSFAFPPMLSVIGSEAFSYTGLEELVFPTNLLYIGENAFAHDHIRSLDFGNNTSMEYISPEAFETQYLSEIKLPIDSGAYEVFYRMNENSSDDRIIWVFYDEYYDDFENEE